MISLRPIVVVGPIPPPLNGFSNVTSQVLELVGEEKEVLLYNQVDRRIFPMALMFCRYLWTLFRRRPTVYLALSGGRRQYIDASYLVAARAFGLFCIVHHHSFAYLDSPTLIARFCIGLANRHIVLCDLMANIIRKTFVSSGDFVVVSNAAFVSSAESPLSSKEGGAGVVLGYISNVSEDKGAWDLFRVIDSVVRYGLRCSLRIAGPVDAAIQEEFFEHVERRAAYVSYAGPLYGVAKDGFFRSIDIFIFPTKYKNEAAPMVIYEALANGVPCVSYSRGCIPEIADMVGLVAVGGVSDPAEAMCAEAILLSRACIDKSFREAIQAECRVLRESARQALLLAFCVG